MFDKFKKYIPVAIVIVIAIALVVGSAMYMGKLGPGGKVPVKDAGAKVLDYVNKTILQGRATATLVGDAVLVPSYNLYKVKFSIQDQEIESYLTTDGKMFFPEGIDMTKDAAAQSPAAGATTVGSFTATTDAVLSENGKPIVYFFGSTTCPHCVWEKPVIAKAIAKFGSVISYHENIDNEKDKDIFSKYSTGGIPTVVIAGKYYRVGSGENSGEETEIKNLTALICKVTGNKPDAVCSAVQDIISQIKD
jgi:thiol-disulfide isomerase/thioredoxin